ncbi:MAG TPA: glycosyltransferase family 2 protein [Candidatus Saccharimonadales bacterium]|nr:glycosyltransferase family 2 protein [Candidatus Saccharimonadales bacterium]
MRTTTHRILVPDRSAQQTTVPDRQVSVLQRSINPPERSLQITRHPVQPIMRQTHTTLSEPQPFMLPMPPVLPKVATVLSLSAVARQAEKLGTGVEDLVLLLPAHNEELIIAETIRSAIAAGQPKKDIYVVNDNSSDDTEAIAIRLLGKDNVLTVERSGKALAVKKAINAFQIESRYTWLHIADADSIFSQNYFRHYRKKLDPKKYAVAVGFVQSLRGNWISTYRALTYTYSQQVTRRVQSHLGMISVFPGPITCFRTDIIKDLEFGGASLTEDFDITLQVHRKKLGNILFIPKAVNYTQDPQTIADFCKQNLRWQRGFFQGVKKYRIGFRGQRIDVSLGFQMFQTLFFLLQLLVLLPMVLVMTGNWMVIPVIIAIDIIFNAAIALFSSVAAKRWALIGALPYFYFLRWLEIGIYLMAFVEVIVLQRFQDEIVGWSTADRRYKLSSQALLDVAK